MTRPLSPESLVYDLTPASDPQLSPDGTRILYTRSGADRESRKAGSQLWLCSVEGGEGRRLTWSGERNGGGRWSPDGKQIAFVSDRVKKSGIFVMPADGAGEARELTRHGQAVSDLAWSPDGRRIAYTTQVDPENPDEEEPPEGAAPRVRVTRRIDYKQDVRGYLGDARSQVFVVDVESGERRQLTREPVDHFFPQWSPDGRRLAVQAPRLNGMRSQLGLVAVDAEGGDGREEMKRIGPPDGVVGVWSWSPSGERILFAGDTQLTYQLDLFVYDVAAETVRRLTDDLQVLPAAGFGSVIPPSQPVWLDDRQVLLHAVRAGASGLHVVDSETGSIEPVHGWGAIHLGLSADRARRRVVQSRSGFEEFGEIATFDLASAAPRVVTAINAPVLRERPPAAWERFEVRRGDLAIEVWLLKPPGFDPTRRYPLILDVHGGPNGFYGYNFNAVQQCLATNGFLVVIANPRGSSSYGRDFTLRVLRDWGGEDYRDLMAVVDAALERPYADPERTGIYGYSYGGYMTSWTIGQTDRFRAAVCGAPVFDLESFFGTSDIGHTFGAQQFGAAPHEDRAWYDAHSPSNFAHRVRTPTLIVHGEADERCPIGQGEQLFIALKEAGCEVEFARYPGGSHLFVNLGPPAHREDYLGRILAWFKSHLGEPA
ncbi:MAG: S9 family peptidase [Chloroflexota bacterium]|nr:S9 family peptidase [Chloroflexota bacterium]